MREEIKMNIDFFKVLTSRRSIRMYRSTAVEKSELYLLAEMGLKAPSAGDLQDTRIIVCTDKKIIYQLPELCMDQMWITSAPAVLVVCSQPQKQAEWFGERGRHVFATQNAAAVTQNILLSAQALGLGACWVGGFNQEKIDELFKAEGTGRVESIVTVGYPAERPQPKEEINIADGMYFNTFGNTKADKDLLHNDYSLKLEQYVENAKEQAKKSSSQGNAWIQKIKKKVKEHQDKYKTISLKQKK